MSTQFLHKTHSKLFLLTLIMGMLSLYCAFHLLQGERGYFELKRMQAYEAKLDDELSKLSDKREKLEQRVSRMQASSIDPDMLEQQALFFLGPRRDDQIQMR